MFTRRVAALLAVFFAAGYATAQPGPQLLSVFPPGAKAGSTVEVTFGGHGFDGQEKLFFSEKGFEAELVGTVPAPKQPQQGRPSTFVKFKVTVPKDIASGTLDVRIVSKNGLSNPRAFVVSNMTDVNETEPNNDVGQAQKIELDTTVNGIIGANTDVDYVTFKAKAGQNIVVYCLSSSLDGRLSMPDLIVVSSTGKQLASNRGYRAGEAVLDFQAPTDGDYLVRLSQFAYSSSGFDHFYRLTVTTGPWVDAIFPPTRSDNHTIFGRNLNGAKPTGHFNRPDGRPLDSLSYSALARKPFKPEIRSTGIVSPRAASLDAWATGTTDGLLVLGTNAGELILDNEKNTTADSPQEVKVPCDVAGRIAKKNERHWYSFEANKGEVWTLEVFAERIGSPVDAYFILTDDKGKVIVELDDGADSLSPNQFYTKGDDPARYRFVVPNDGTYKVMVSTREAGTQFGVRDQYVLRIAKENPDFRVAVMPLSPFLPEGGTLPKGGAVLFSVFVFRFDGFNDSIELTASDLPEGVTCPPQVIGPGQTRGTLVLVADKDAEDWEGFVKIHATSGDLKHTARPFTITWPAIGVQPTQPPPNAPMITRMDRGPGLALAIRGETPFSLTPTKEEVKAKAGGKVEVTLKVDRRQNFKDAIQLFFVVPTFGPRQPGGNPRPQPIATATSTQKELKLSIDVPANLPPGTHTLVLRGQSGAPLPKGPVVRPIPTYPSVPITVIVEGTPKKK
ncbi:MAG: PPC domain-containing protein [Planctomycetia bacterium]|nr:PPC domain-containing protein [Planctomycetia bacterium]